MRPPYTPEIGEKAVTSATVHTPSPEFRTRIESDVRFYTRQPSSPWITFDREGNAPILESAHSSILPSQGVFPTPAYPSLPAPTPEPSNMIVAADVNAQTGEAPVVYPEPRLPRKVVALIGMTIAAAIVVGVGAKTASDPIATAAPPPKVASAPPPVVQADPPPPDLAAAPAAVAPTKKAFGKLTIKGDARTKNVYMDGKRMLGAGTRTFAVLCGSHSIAVGTKDDAHGVDVPCNGELVVGK